MLKRMGCILLDLVYPPRCPGCGGSVDVHGKWCRPCFAKIWQPRMISGSHKAGKLDGCYALTSYSGDMKKILRTLKYNRALKYEKGCQYILEAFPWQDRLATIDAVVPVPLSARRMHKRGYNQTEVIFRPWVERYGCWEDLLARVRSTEAQWHLNKQQREENLKRAFEIRKDSFCVIGTHLLLVDDIYTTGATLQECAYILKQKGAASVTGLVISSGAL